MPFFVHKSKNQNSQILYQMYVESANLVYSLFKQSLKKGGPFHTIELLCWNTSMNIKNNCDSKNLC